MPDHKNFSQARKSVDGFARLSGAMMERENPPPWGTGGLPQETGSPAEFGRLNRGLGKRAERPHARPLPASEGADQLAQQPQRDSRPDEGPERRLRNVSPVLERRSAMPPRTRVSVRLENHRYSRLKSAAVLLERTHQDLLTSALDLYLGRLGIPSLK
ncbi:MAG: hypothetical protein COA62_11380 [Rhodobiaceae bacterium]|nr:MAG: hypothetical protein COA62_11380 [Rhodobiaceae bacterium]